MSLGVFDQPFKWRWHGRNYASFSVVPGAPGIDVQFGRWAVSPAAQKMFGLADASGIDITFSVDGFSHEVKSGYGNAGRVLATVVEIVQDEIERSLPAVVEVLTFNHKLARAYARIFKRVKHPRYTAWAGYIDGSHYFVLVRDLPPDADAHGLMERL